MIRRTPAGKQAARLLPMVAVLVALGFVTATCTSDEPTEVASQVAVQANNHQGGGPAASCAAPCLEVAVTAKGNKPPTDSDPRNTMVVTLVNGGRDVNDPGIGFVAAKAIGSDGIARFLFNQAPDHIPLEEGGYCAYVTSVTNADIQRGAGDNTIPAADLSNPALRVVSAPFLGAVSESPNKSKTLTQSSYLANCVNWTNAANAPFFVNASTALTVKLKVSEARASETVLATCRYFDGGDAPQGVVVGDALGFCPSWGVISLEEEDLPPGQPALPGWLTGAVALGTDGVKRGVLITAANANPSRLYVPSGQGIALEAATTGENIQETTFSTLASGGDKVTADVDPTVCFVNERAVTGPVTCGIRFLNMQDGYIALSSLNQAGFGFDDKHVVIWYDYKRFGGNESVTLKGRLRQNPDCISGCVDALPTSANFQIAADFGVSCQPGSQPNVAVSGFVSRNDVTVQCRTEGADFRATWVIKIPASRVVEYRLETTCGSSSPPPARDGTGGDARWLIEFPTQTNGQLAGGQCILPQSTIGDASKWWVGG